MPVLTHLQTLPQPPTITSHHLNPSDYPVFFPSNKVASPVFPSEPPTKTFSLASHVNTPTGTDHLKLFFERFPSWVEYQDLKKTFGKFGQVIKLFLSKRKTVLGRRFGFVDILSPLPVIDICDQASKVWFDSYKLRVNPAKLQSSKPPPPTSPTKPLSKPASPHKPQLMFRDNRSFAEVLTSKPQYMGTMTRRMIQYNSTVEDQEWLHRSLVGNILPNVDLATLEATVLKSSVKAMSFRFLGASQVIITYVDQLASMQEQMNKVSMLHSLFSNLRQWETRTRAYDRFAWISIFGLPMEGWNKNCINILLQSWGNIVGYDTSCVSQGSISGIRVLIRTTTLEPLHDQVLLQLDGVQVEVSLKEIKGEFIPSLTTIKHSMDVSLCSTTVLSDDDEDDFCEETNRAATTHIETKQKPEFEYEFTGLLGSKTQIASTLIWSEVSPMYLYPEITEFCRHAGLSNESTSEVDNRLALVPFVCVEVDSVACGEVDVQHVSCFPIKDGLDQHIVYDSGLLQNMGRKKQQKSSSIGSETNRDSTSIGPSFTTFITPIVDPYELTALEVGNRKSHRKHAKKLTRRTKSLRRRKSSHMGKHNGMQSETVIVEYSVSDNGIKNRNAIIKSGKELIGEDEASSSRYRPDTNVGDEAYEPTHSDNWAEATACWEVGKVILQGHDDSTLMTQTLQGFLDREQEEWILRKKT
ncbi:hypothetical protein POTOM_015195 [Populus tomentosa]|uniref:RRM domain-containing protein n=1 Tax=Populus tomentosa TaxID=118781 RepID=A0A8X8A2M8_POPTO|nr:hypothetical protein POTOM_015195 [Populus tomentosa]